MYDVGGIYAQVQDTPRDCKFTVAQQNTFEIEYNCAERASHLACFTLRAFPLVNPKRNTRLAFTKEALLKKRTTVLGIFHFTLDSSLYALCINPAQRASLAEENFITRGKTAIRDLLQKYTI